jgi:hypothetical protein
MGWRQGTCVCAWHVFLIPWRCPKTQSVRQRERRRRQGGFNEEEQQRLLLLLLFACIVVRGWT